MGESASDGACNSSCWARKTAPRLVTANLCRCLYNMAGSVRQGVWEEIHAARHHVLTSHRSFSISLSFSNSCRTATREGGRSAVLPVT